MSAQQPPHQCGLCFNSARTLFFTETKGRLQGRQFWHCPRCHLVQVPPHQRLTPELEQAEYDLHQNNPDDSGYRRFLSKVSEPLLARLTPSSSGLDFGCGPGPTLSLMLQEHGHRCANYDLYYANDPTLLQQTYDFITCTEVIEHVAAPAEVFQQLNDCLKPGGVLAMMTQYWRNASAFQTWRYKADPTHISFFTHATMQYVAQVFALDLVYFKPPVCFFIKR